MRLSWSARRLALNWFLSRSCGMARSALVRSSNILTITRTIIISTFKPAELERLRPVVLFDLLINNADRKGSHILVQKRTRRLYLIDHGLCFHAEDKLRTVVWDFAGEPIPAELLSALSNFRAHLAGPGDLSAILGQYLNPEELNALRSRAEAILASGKFPLPPDDRRAFPYPPI